MFQKINDLHCKFYLLLSAVLNWVLRAKTKVQYGYYEKEVWHHDENWNWDAGK